MELLAHLLEGRGDERQVVVLQHLLEIDEKGVSCWMCFECLKCLQWGVLPKGVLANNLWIGNIPSQLTGLMIPEQLLIAQYYPQCYIFKLFPHDYGCHLPIDQPHLTIAGNASLFELNTQEVVEMLEGQYMPSSVMMLASIIVITFVGSKKLPVDWLKKMFQVRRQVHQEKI